jgi:hypothetical protein
LGAGEVRSREAATGGEKHPPAAAGTLFKKEGRGKVKIKVKEKEAGTPYPLF